MHEISDVAPYAESSHYMPRHRPLVQIAIVAVLILMAATCHPDTKRLPAGGTSSWSIEELEVVVTFLLFDPNDPGVALPKGLRFVSASEVAKDSPEFQEHLKQYPEQTNWAFSFVEFIRPKVWLLDNNELTLPENSGIAVWFAPVDHSQLASEISRDRFEAVIAPSPDAVLVLGLWVPDRQYAAFMRSRGHRADHGMVTVAKDSAGTIHGELRLDDLSVKASATPEGEIRHEPDPFTQVFFEPGERVERVVVLAGRNARERDCTAQWVKFGDHPLSRGVFVGPTFLNVEGPLIGSAYRIGEESATADPGVAADSQVKRTR